MLNYYILISFINGCGYFILLICSYERGRSYNTQVGVGWLIRGMDDALIGMCINEHRVVAIPPDLAYGDEGTGNKTRSIAVNRSLIF